MTHLNRKVTSLNIDKDVLEFCRDNKINLSEWVSTEFSKKFLGMDSKIKRLKEIEKEKTQLLYEIELIKERQDSVSKQLTQNEIRYICTVKAKLRSGCDFNSIKNFFNDEYHRNLSLDEFRSLVKFHEDQMEKRTQYAIEKINSKKKK